MKMFKSFLIAFFGLLIVCSLLPFVYNLLTNVGFIVILLILSWKFSKLLRRKLFEQKYINVKEKAVLITGCGTGFGHMLAIQLDSMGFYVYAGCLSNESDGAKELAFKCSKKLTVLKLDVTKDTDVADALKFVRNNLKGKTFWGIVNNAGIATWVGLEFGPPGVDIYQSHHNVNALGVVRITKAFLPLLRKSRGSRVVIVASLAGRHSVLGLASYCMTKFAARSFADGLRRELISWGKDVKVSVIEPLVYRTRLSDSKVNEKIVKKLWEQTPQELRDEYGSQRFQEMCYSNELLMATANQRPQDVVDSIIDALINQDPSLYYRVGNLNDKILIGFLEYFPEEIQDIMLKESTYNLICKLMKK